MPEKRTEKKSKSGKPLGPIGTKVLFENEHIRVWSVELPGKGHQPLHEHEHPYLIVPVSEGKALMRWEDGREREIVDVLGNVVYREASGGPHELFNLEDTKFHSILVEIKAAGAMNRRARAVPPIRSGEATAIQLSNLRAKAWTRGQARG